MRNTGQSFCKQKISPDNFKSIAMLSFQTVGWKMVMMISLKMRNLGFRIFCEFGFSDNNAASQKILNEN